MFTPPRLSGDPLCLKVSPFESSVVLSIVLACFFMVLIYGFAWLFMVLPMVVSMGLASVFIVLSMAVSCFSFSCL